MDLTMAITSHCFPGDASHHFVCCTNILDPNNSNSPHGNQNPLYDAIMTASQDQSNLSWCTCSEEICTEQLGGTVTWNMHGEGWKGFRPKRVPGGGQAKKLVI